MKGNLRKWKLIGGDDKVQRQFELAMNYVNDKPRDAPRYDDQDKVRRRGGGYTRTQLASMGGLVERYADTATMENEWQNPKAKKLPLDWASEFELGGAEFLLHGTASDWDTVYSSDGLKPVGTNPGLDDHVYRSYENATAYVSGTRELATAKSFAKSENGWVYLFHVREGVINFRNVRHRQAEVLAVGDVPRNDILLIRHLSEPSIVYQNLDYRATTVSNEILSQTFRFIGGGEYPKTGIFWTNV